jgi:hypothetical protein
MWVAVLNNLPELVLGTAWTGLVFWIGRRWERRFPKKLAAKVSVE